MECVDSETEQHFADPIDVLFGDESVEFVLVLEEDHFGGFLAFGFAFVLNYFVVLRQLYLYVSIISAISDLLDSLKLESICTRLIVTWKTLLEAPTICLNFFVLFLN